MKRILAIAGVALKRFARDRSNLFFVFILPIGIILLIGAQFGGGVEPRAAVHLPDDSGPLAQQLAEAIEASGEVIVIDESSRDGVVDRVAVGEAAFGVVIPDGFDAALMAGENVAVEMVGPEGALLGGYQSFVTDAMAALSQRESAIRFAVARGADREQAAAAVDAIVDRVPAINIESTEIGESLFAGVSGQFQLGSTSQLVLFMFLTGLTGSAALIQSKRYGVTRRMLSTPSSPFSIVAGEGLGRFAVVLVQGLYIIIATTLMFQTDWGNILGVIGILIAFGAVGAGGAMLFGTLFRNDQQATGIGVVAGIGLAALGGCMVPIEIFPPAMETVARITPHAWAMDAFAELQRRDGTLIDILPQLGVILLFAIVLIGLASWRMRATMAQSYASA